jgi:hypothetical protein
MKTTQLTLAAALLLAFLNSCQNKSADKFDKIKKMEWLVGNWEQKLPDGIITETWTKDNDSTFSGKSFFIKEKDTIHLENIVLTQKKDELLYIPTVNGQNNDEPVTFKLTSEAANAFTFENPTHDYPQKITYKKVATDRLVATISGIQQGKQSQESYPMSKK